MILYDKKLSLKENCTLVRREAHQLFCEKFKRKDISLDNFKALCNIKGWMTGRDERLMSRNVSWNKGKKKPFNANTAKTQFKKGSKPHNTKYLGHERVTKDGYIEINVGAKEDGHKNNYLLKHKYLWEQVNGKMADDMCLKCLDGNRQNVDPSNWEAIARGALPFLNGFRGYDYDKMPSEIKPIALNLAKVKYAKPWLVSSLK